MLWQSKSLNPNEFFKLALEQYLVVKCAMLKQSFEALSLQTINSSNPSGITPSNYSDEKQDAVCEFMRDFVGFAKQMVGKNSKNPTMLIAEIIERYIIIDIEHLRRRSTEVTTQLPRDMQNKSFKQTLLSLDRIDIHAVQLSARLWCMRLMYEYLMFAEKVPKGGNYRDRYETDIVKHVDQIKVIASMSDSPTSSGIPSAVAAAVATNTTIATITATIEKTNIDSNENRPTRGSCVIQRGFERVLNGCVAIEFYTFLNNFAIRNELSSSIRKHLKQSYMQLTNKFSTSTKHMNSHSHNINNLNEHSSNISIQPHVETSQTMGMISSSLKQQQQQQQQPEPSQQLQQQQQQSVVLPTKQQNQKEQSRNIEQVSQENQKMIAEIEIKQQKAVAVNSQVTLVEKAIQKKVVSNSAITQMDNQVQKSALALNSTSQMINENSSNKHLLGVQSQLSSQIISEDFNNSKKVSISTRSSVLASVNSMSQGGRTMYQQLNKKVTRLSTKQQQQQQHQLSSQQQQQQQQQPLSSSQIHSHSKSSRHGNNNALTSSSTKSQSKSTTDGWMKQQTGHGSLVESTHKSFLESEYRKSNQLKLMSREPAGIAFDSKIPKQSQQQKELVLSESNTSLEQQQSVVKHKRMFSQTSSKSANPSNVVVVVDDQDHENREQVAQNKRKQTQNNNNNNNLSLSQQQQNLSDDETSMPFMFMWGL